MENGLSFGTVKIKLVCKIKADILNHGCPIFRRKVLQMCRRVRRQVAHRGRGQQVPMHGQKLLLDQLKDHLRPRGSRLPRTLSGRDLRRLDGGHG